MIANRHRGRVAVITGGAQGIGLACARRLAGEGAVVYVLDTVDPPEGPESTASGDIRGYRCDVADPAAIAAAVERIRSGSGDPTIAVHCAAYQRMVPFTELTTEQWERTQRVNVDGGFHLARQVVPGMRQAGWGRIVMVASSSFFAPPAGMSHYIASKGALIGLVRGLAVDLGPDGITVNAIAPGLTRSANAIAAVPAEHFAAVISRQALKRSGEPDDQAAALSFLVSDDAGFMSGQTMLIDGGEGHV